MGHVYIIQMNEHWKIGMTNNLKHRMSHYKAMPVPIEGLYLIETDNPESLEKELHTTYWNKRHKGEWFNLDESDLHEIQDKYQCVSGDEFVQIKPKPIIQIIPKYKGPGVVLNVFFATTTAFVLSSFVNPIHFKIIFFLMGLHSNYIGQYFLNMGSYYKDKSKLKSYSYFSGYVFYIITLVITPTIYLALFVDGIIYKYVILGAAFVLTGIVSQLFRIQTKFNFTFLDEYEIISPEDATLPLPEIPEALK